MNAKLSLMVRLMLAVLVAAATTLMLAGEAHAGGEFVCVEGKVVFHSNFPPGNWILNVDGVPYPITGTASPDPKAPPTGPTTVPINASLVQKASVTTADGQPADLFIGNVPIVCGPPASQGSQGNTTVLPDGTKVTVNPDGTKITDKPDGIKETVMPDGTRVTERPNGMKMTETPTGTIIFETRDGTKTTERLGGNKVARWHAGDLEPRQHGSDGTT